MDVPPRTAQADKRSGPLPRRCAGPRPSGRSPAGGGELLALAGASPGSRTHESQRWRPGWAAASCSRWRARADADLVRSRARIAVRPGGRVAGVDLVESHARIAVRPSARTHRDGGPAAAVATSGARISNSAITATARLGGEGPAGRR
jgi:hypothetical protein